MCLFPVCGDLNWHHRESLGFTTTNRHGVAAFDFATMSGCDQFVVGPTHARGVTLGHLITGDPNLVRVPFVALIGNTELSVGSHFDGSGGSNLVC